MRRSSESTSMNARGVDDAGDVAVGESCFDERVDGFAWRYVDGGGADVEPCVAHCVGGRICVGLVRLTQTNIKRLVDNNAK
jgi:hypothetical protein